MSIQQDLSSVAPIKVLVVEDDPLVRLTILDMVADAGFAPLEAENAAGALSVLEVRDDVGIVLTDVEMPPGIDGLRLAALIHDRWPAIDIIIASARAAPGQAQMPARSVFLMKPLTDVRVADELRKFVDRRPSPADR